MANSLYPIEKGDRLFRVQVLKYPEGAALELCYPDIGQPAAWVPVPGWAPPGWKPDEDYLGRNRTSEFKWPSTKHWYRSRSGARRRARLIESYGASVTIEESQPIVWPRHAPLGSPDANDLGDDQASGVGIDYALMGRRLAYDVARSHDDYFEVQRLLDSCAKRVGSSAEFGQVLELALEYMACHLVVQLVFFVEHPQIHGPDVRSWIAEWAAYFWSEEAAGGR